MERITADNFITDNKTNKVYISSLIDGETGALDVDTRSQLKTSILKFARNGNSYITLWMSGQGIICLFS